MFTTLGSQPLTKEWIIHIYLVCLWVVIHLNMLPSGIQIAYYKIHNV